MAKPVRCQRCGRENDPSFAFCLDCGQSLRAAPAAAAPACAACGAPLQPGFRFCGKCGKPVGAPAPPRPAPQPARPAPAPAPVAPRAAPAPAPPRPAPAPASRFKITTVRSDGMSGTSFAVEREEMVCGRTGGEVRLPADATVSPRHARFVQANGAIRVEDLGSANGTYVRIKEPRRLAIGEEFRVGRQLLRLEPLPRPARADDRGARPWGSPDAGCRLRLAQLLDGGGVGEIFPLHEGENVVGRDAGDVTFPSDRYVSARHARIEVQGTAVTLADAGSSNGTFARIAGAVELVPGDQLLIGGQLLRIDG